MLTTRSIDAAGRVDQRAAVAGIGDIAGDDDLVRPITPFATQRLSVAGVDDDPPSTLDEGPGEGAAQAA